MERKDNDFNQPISSMEILTPPPLQQGDTIAIISTARKVHQGFIDHAKSLIESWGYKVKLGAHLFDKEHQFAGNDIARRADLAAALGDPAVKAIFCARGGYGTARILEGIDYKEVRNHPKWVVGYSDATALHNHLYRQAGIQSIHGSMPVNFEENTAEALDSLRILLEGNAVTYTSPQSRFNREGECEGEMVGGNLSVIYSLMGTPSEIDTAGKVLFLEDLDEYLYHIDRMMVTLKRAGKLRQLAGLVVGSMTDMRDNQVPFGKTAEEIIASQVAAYNYPTCYGFPSGHIADNRAWIHGKKVRLTVKNDQPSSLNHC